MAVPAAPMSITSGMSCSAATITRVSSQSDRFSGWNSLRLRALMMSARLLMLLLAGRSMRACKAWGAVISIVLLYCMSQPILIWHFSIQRTNLRKSLVITKKRCTFAHANAKERDVAQPGRVRVWGACGRKFESCHPDSMKRGTEEIRCLFRYSRLLRQRIRRREL